MKEPSVRRDDVPSSAAGLFFEDALGVSPGVFLDEIFEQRHHGPHRAAAHLGAAEVATLADVDYLLNHAAQRSRQVQLIEHGSPVHDPHVIDRGDRVNVDYLYERFVHGASFRIPHVHYRLPLVADFCRQLGTALAVKVAADAYISPAPRRRMRPHYDSHDLIALQCAGRQRWRLFAANDDAPASPRAQRVDPARHQPGGVMAEATLAPGDMLYVPRGLMRQVANDDVSLHLAFEVQAPTWGELARRALQMAMEEDVALRTALPHAIRVDPSIADATAAPAIVRALMTNGRLAQALGEYRDQRPKMQPARHWFSTHQTGEEATERLRTMLKERFRLGGRRYPLPRRGAVQ